ncbi:hypothetical protein HNR00_004231 [Methylorubrum rhodinum]|uniref:DUF4258 domain-containing protein n=1 Tax=Methylorubrum rhodinum TaxID=29428 RepID=A0A840ZRM0_9HYPH|nr:hypothetical protein [Methylorubrum rhodinum]MBB5759497.1 hypothetical protein [Methylorubrum rhodinum]
MDTQSIDVSYQAEPGYDRLSDSEKAEVADRLGNPAAHPELHRHVADDRVLTRIGRTKRVLWTRSEDGRARILSVVDRAGL